MWQFKSESDRLRYNYYQNLLHFDQILSKSKVVKWNDDEFADVQLSTVAMCSRRSVRKQSPDAAAASSCVIGIVVCTVFVRSHRVDRHSSSVTTRLTAESGDVPQTAPASARRNRCLSATDVFIVDGRHEIDDRASRHRDRQRSDSCDDCRRPAGSFRRWRHGCCSLWCIRMYIWRRRSAADAGDASTASDTSRMYDNQIQPADESRTWEEEDTLLQLHRLVDLNWFDYRGHDEFLKLKTKGGTMRNSYKHCHNHIMKAFTHWWNDEVSWCIFGPFIYELLYD